MCNPNLLYLHVFSVKQRVVTLLLSLNYVVEPTLVSVKNNMGVNTDIFIIIIKIS